MLSRLYRTLLVIALVFVGTGAAAADALDDIVARGTLRIGVSEFVPWTIKTESGELKGFEIDVGGKIARDMGVDPEFTGFRLEPSVQIRWKAMT